MGYGFLRYILLLLYCYDELEQQYLRVVNNDNMLLYLIYWILSEQTARFGRCSCFIHQV